MKIKKILGMTSVCFIGVVAFCLLGLTAHDTWRFHRIQKRINDVAVGDSRDHVRQVMGEPDASWGRQKQFMTNVEMPPGFAYGKTMDWGNAFYADFPFFCPFRIRLFGPCHDDIVVAFDDNGIVTGVRAHND